MEKEEFPVPVDPPTVDVSVASEESEAQLATVAKSTRPRLPVIFYRLMAKSRLKAIRQYIASFEYSLNPQTNFNSQKQRPLFLIMETAKTIINAPQPIKCVEAVFVALLLTAGLPDVERFPLSFQTVLDDQVYQHIVLLVQYFGKFGAFGISRWPEFMSKELKFDSMSSVIENYKTAYEEQRHVVEKIRVGLPVEHNTRSTNFVCWRHLELDLGDQSWPECVDAIDDFAAKGKRLWNLWIRSGRGEDPRHFYIRQTKRLLAGRESSPRKAKRLNSARSTTLQARSSELAAEAFENSGRPESVEFIDSRNVNCRFNIQPPSSRESARITLSLEPGEVPYLWKTGKDAKKAPELVLQKEFCFNKSTVAVRSPSNHGFSKIRRSKKFFKIGLAQSEDAAIRSLKSIKGAIRSLPRAAQNQSVEQPLVVSQCLLGTKYLNGTPGFDGPKTCWECLKTVYRTKNEARLLVLKDKLADLRMQGPLEGEAFRVVQDIFQQLVGIGESITSRLDVFEGTINSLSENFDAVVQSVNSQSELHSLKELAKQLAEESQEKDISTDILQPIKRKKGVNEESLVAKRSISPSLRKMRHDSEPLEHYRVPPCNWCGLHGHRMRDCQDLEKEIARRVREYKYQAGPTLPNSSREEPMDHQQLETETVRSLEPSGKLVLWHKNRFKDSMQSKMQEQTGENDAQRQNDPRELVAGEEMDSLTGVGEDQLTTPMEQRGGTKLSRKKRSLVQRRLRTKLMYLLGIDKPSPQSPQVRNRVNRGKTLQEKKSCKDIQSGNGSVKAGQSTETKSVWHT